MEQPHLHKEFQRDPAPLNRLERLSTGCMEFHGRKYGFRHQPVEVLDTATLGLLFICFFKSHFLFSSHISFGIHSNICQILTHTNSQLESKITSSSSLRANAKSCIDILGSGSHLALSTRTAIFIPSAWPWPKSMFSSEETDSWRWHGDQRKHAASRTPLRSAWSPLIQPGPG